MKCFPNPIRHWQHVECAKWAMPRCSYWILKRYFRESSAYEQSRRLDNWPARIRSMSSCNISSEKKQKNKPSRRLIEEVCHYGFYPASRFRSGAIWGLFYWLSEYTPSCYKKHTHTKILLDKNSHPQKKEELNHITLAMATLREEQQFKYSWSVSQMEISKH